MQKSLMPKGVDHLSVRLSDNGEAENVQKSLMPKGVDHPSPAEVWSYSFADLCKNL